MVLQEVRRRYAGKAKAEWERLRATPITRIEYMITHHCLERYLPEAGRILDAGSGPGRYAIDLARQGYRVMMFDLVREMLQLGRIRVTEAGVGDRIATPVEGDIAALPYADDAFDAVLCLGAPLSHITAAQARASAVREMARVVRPGGSVFLTGISRLASYRGGIYWGCWKLWNASTSAEAQASGICEGSQIWYCFATGELEDLAQDAGLQVVDRVGCEGLASYLPMRRLEQVEKDPKRWPIWRDILLETCNDPTIIGVSNHLLVVTRKEQAIEQDEQD